MIHVKVNYMLHRYVGEGSGKGGDGYGEGRRERDRWRTLEL